MATIRLRFVAAILVLLFSTAFPTASEPQTRADGKLILEQFDVAKDGDLLLVPVCIRGKTYQFVLDTGAGWTLCDTSLRSLLGKQGEDVVIGTAGDPTTLETYEAPNATVGKLTRSKSPVVMADLKKLRQASGHEIHGILGMDFLIDYVIRLDLDQGKVLFMGSAGRNSGDPVRLLFPEPRKGPHISAIVAGGAREQFLVDTGRLGFDSGMLRAEVIDSLVKGRKAKMVGEGLSENLSGTTEKSKYWVNGLSVGPFRHQSLIFDKSARNVLGLRYLARYVVTFDFPKKMMYLKKSSRFSKPDQRYIGGLAIRRVDKMQVVDWVEDGGPADRSGIRADDVVVRINGKPAGDMRPFALLQVFCSEGETIRMVIRRGKKEFEVSMVLEDRRHKDASPKGKD